MFSTLTKITDPKILGEADL